MNNGEYITLLRHTHWPTGTYGEMRVGEKILYTCERGWSYNRQNISCIPEGHYQVVRHTSPKYGECFAITGDKITIHQVNDTDRWGILFHPANWPDQLQGCISPGLFFSPIEAGKRQWPECVGVGRSQQAFNYMMNTLPDIWHLHITHAESH